MSSMGRGMIECVHAGLIQDFEFWVRGGGGGNPKFGIDMEGFIAQNN